MYSFISVGDNLENVQFHQCGDNLENAVPTVWGTTSKMQFHQCGGAVYGAEAVKRDATSTWD